MSSHLTRSCWGVTISGCVLREDSGECGHHVNS